MHLQSFWACLVITCPTVSNSRSAGQIINSTLKLLSSGCCSRLVCVPGITLATGVSAAGDLAMDPASPARPSSS